MNFKMILKGFKAKWMNYVHRETQNISYILHKLLFLFNYKMSIYRDLYVYIYLIETMACNNIYSARLM